MPPRTASAGVDIDEGDRLVELIKPLARPPLRPRCSPASAASAASSPSTRSAGAAGAGGLRDGRRGHEAQARLPHRAATTRGHRPGGDVVKRRGGDRRRGASSSSTTTPPDACARGGGPGGERDRRGCRQAGCALIGGGDRRAPRLLPGRGVRPGRLRGGRGGAGRDLDGPGRVPGDVLVGWPLGPHSNGYSLARRRSSSACPLDRPPSSAAAPSPTPSSSPRASTHARWWRCAGRSR